MFLESDDLILFHFFFDDLFDLDLSSPFHLVDGFDRAFTSSMVPEITFSSITSSPFSVMVVVMVAEMVPSSFLAISTITSFCIVCDTMSIPAFSILYPDTASEDKAILGQ